MPFINVETASDGDGLKTLTFRADRDYILDAVDLSCPSQTFGDIEVSGTDVRQSGLHIARHAWEWELDWCMWTGWLILRENEFVLGHIHVSDSGDRLNMRLHVNPITTRFQAVLG